MLSKGSKILEDVNVPPAVGCAYHTYQAGKGDTSCSRKICVVWAEGRGLRPNTIKFTLSAIANWHRAKNQNQNPVDKGDLDTLMRTAKVKWECDNISRQGWRASSKKKIIGLVLERRKI